MVQTCFHCLFKLHAYMNEHPNEIDIIMMQDIPSEFPILANHPHYYLWCESERVRVSEDDSKHPHYPPKLGNSSYKPPKVNDVGFDIAHSVKGNIEEAPWTPTGVNKKKVAILSIPCLDFEGLYDIFAMYPHIIFGGDLNAHHPLWGGPESGTTVCGEALYNLVEAFGMKCLNEVDCVLPDIPGLRDQPNAKAVESMAILGVVVHCRLNWDLHMSKIKASVSTETYSLLKLLRTQSGPRQWRRLFLSNVQSKMTYACAAWSIRNPGIIFPSTSPIPDSLDIPSG
ncbi:Uu.00g088670.m01.CDS01 [Anthostomella pinea]|uniref:Uu.00g088670.m01.CDS01 n=1 Tax=Anthostomella pinea TaxID=933095 RepID=A0AAI8YJZ8_9PEZI|nr:Uu.00g088670.m01.CDS01 [Anthostomella pinea]